MTKRIPPEHVTKLKAADQFRLMEFVRDNYVREAKSDIEFAKLASNILGIQVTNHNVAGARDAFGIPSTKYANKKPETRLDKLESRIVALEQFMKEFK